MPREMTEENVSFGISSVGGGGGGCGTSVVCTVLNLVVGI